jgi:hypothetical protein
MRSRGVLIPLLVIACAVNLGFGQTRKLATGSTVNASTIIANAWAAFSNSLPINSVQLSGEIATQAGATSDSGTVTAVSRVDTTSSTQLNLTSGTWTETRVAIANSGIYQCTWSGPDGAVHNAASHNCVVPASWMCPSLMLQPGLTPSNVGIAYIAHETLGDEGVEHVQMQVIYGNAQTPTNVTALLEQVSTVDLYVDSSSFLPVMLRTTLRADNDANTSIPVEVHYSNFIQSSGVTVPSSIQRYIDSSLQDSVTLTGVSAN